MPDTVQFIRWKPQNKRQKSAINAHGIWWKIVGRKPGLIMIEASGKRDLRWIQDNQLLETVTPDSEWIRVFDSPARSVPT